MPSSTKHSKAVVKKNHAELDKFVEQVKALDMVVHFGFAESRDGEKIMLFAEKQMHPLTALKIQDSVLHSVQGSLPHLADLTKKRSN